MHKRIALEHKEISEDHEPTNEYSYNHKRSQRLEMIKRGGSKYLKERWAYWPYTYTETPSDKPVKQMDLVRRKETVRDVHDVKVIMFSY